MRVVHVRDLPALARIATPDDLIVAVPSQLSTVQVLDLASLVLNPDEYAALASQVAADTAEYASR